MTFSNQFRPSAVQLSHNFNCHLPIMSLKILICVCELVCVYNPVACQHTHTQTRITQIIFPYFFHADPFNLLLVNLISVQISHGFGFLAHFIPELKLDVTSYTHYESQRGSTFRSTQITTFFLCPFSLFLSVSLSPRPAVSPFFYFSLVLT